MENLKVERLTRDKLKDVQYLIKEVFNKKYSLKYLENKYNTLKYCDIEYISKIAYLNSKPVGFYGVLPLVFKEKEEQYIGAQVCDLCIVKDYRGREIHALLRNSFYETAAQLKIDFVYGFLNENSRAAYKKTNWKEYDKFKRFEIDTKFTFSVFKILSKYPLLINIKRKRIEKVLNNYRGQFEFKNDYLKEDFLAARYTGAYINYKNFKNNTIIKIEDCLVWLKLDFSMQIGAFQNLNDNNFLIVFNELENIAKKLKIDKIIIQLSEDTKQFKLLSSNFKIKESWVVAYYLFNNKVNFNNARFNWIELDSFL